MKHKKEIELVLKNRIQHELKKAYIINLARKPCNCVFNLPYRLNNKELVGSCLILSKYDTYKPNQGVYFCDSDDIAIKCSRYKCKFKKEQVKEIFEKDIQDAEFLKKEYKDIYTLMWVLEEEKPKKSFKERLSGFWEKFKDKVFKLGCKIF